MSICRKLLGYVVFLFKQKAAYELRISDWSSDVCSSDLGPQRDDDEGGVESGDHGVVSFRGTFALTPRPPTYGLLRSQRDEPRGRTLDGDSPLGALSPDGTFGGHGGHGCQQIGRASCRERVGQYV